MINFHSPQRESDWNRIPPRACSGCGSGETSMKVVLQKPGRRTNRNRNTYSAPGISEADQPGCAPLLLTASSRPHLSVWTLSVYRILIHPFSTLMVWLVLSAPVLGPMSYSMDFISLPVFGPTGLVAPSLYNHRCSDGIL